MQNLYLRIKLYKVYYKLSQYQDNTQFKRFPSYYKWIFVCWEGLLIKDPASDVNDKFGAQGQWLVMTAKIVNSVAA